MLVLEHLEHVVTTVRTILDRSVADDATQPYQPSQAMVFCEQVLREDAARAHEESLPDLVFGSQYGVTSAELFILWVALVPRVEPQARAWIRNAQRGQHDRVDIALCMRLFCEGRGDKQRLLEAVSTHGRLRRYGLLSRISQSSNPLDDELQPHEQVVHCFSGLRAISESARLIATWLTPTLSLDALDAPKRAHELADLVEHFQTRLPLHQASALGHAGMGFAAGVLCLVLGPSGSGRTTLAKGMAGTLKRRLILVDGDLLSAMPLREAAAAVEDLCLESELFGDVLCVRSASRIMDRESQLAWVFARALRRRAAVVIFCAQPFEGDRMADELTPFVIFRCLVDAASTTQQGQQTWRANMPPNARVPEPSAFQALAQRITLTPMQIRKATHLAYLLGDELQTPQGEDTGRIDMSARLIERAAREQISKSIGSMATVSEPKLALNDLILDEDTYQQILEIVAAGRHRREVLVDWGVGRRIQRGTGIVVLFDGDPGTGKTHASEVIASTLGLSLVRVNIASIVDKYIGETEKNLTEIFSKSRPDTSLLLFDEADSLFSKRTTDVSKSSDRYSNMNINVLLQLIERYDGVTVLTTNLKRAIDPAFERRFTYKIHFDLPKEPERLRLWRYLLPEDVKVGEEIDYEWLSEVELSGGEIKNAILLAAYRAVHRGHLLDNDSLYQAASREAAASGRMVRRFDD